MFIGTGKVDAAYVGSSAVSKMYIGTTKVWPLANDWTLPSNQTLVYDPPADQYDVHEWNMSTVLSVDTGEKWLANQWDRMAIYVNGGLTTASTVHTIKLNMQTTSGNPGAGTNSGFNTFRFHAAAGGPGFSPRDVTLNRTDATYTATENTAFGFWSESWEWSVNMTRSSNTSGTMLTTTGIYQ